ncbi:hypothetical protein [Actinomadura harenae]|uniref:Uncharacterized protein n=1 Tax=Actinomadura harenae TaxID=2483351 RepID=A0A3M2LMR2_9ACTN|nr:hypothetical protein [Actinomadura harenae]RMI38416.1 hypothetical protein EBO15_33025 [Actinomadura harenae]
MTSGRVDDASLRLAAEIVRAAYEEGMRRHGMLGSTIAVISSYAQKNLTDLDAVAGPDPDLVELEELRDAILSVAPHIKTGFRHGPDARLLLHVNNPDVGGRFCEDISVRNVPHYLWSWGDTIAPAAAPSIAARRIVHVLATNRL